MTTLRWQRYLILAVVAVCTPMFFGQTVTAQSKPDPHKLPSAPAAMNQTAEGATTGTSTITLQELVSIALARNPAIKGATERFEAQRAHVPQVRALPDPVVSGGWMGKIVPFDVQDGFAPSYRGLAVQQKLPFPGKLKLRGEIADRQAEATGWMAEGTRRQVVAEVKGAYYSYFYDTKAIEIIEKNKNLLEKLEAIAEARYRVGKGIQQDVLRAQIEVSRIDQQLIVLRQQEATDRARLNTLLYRDPEAPLPPPAPFAAASFAFSLQDLYSLARANDPGLEEDRRMVEGNQDAVRLAQKQYDPDFTVNYTYQQRPDLKDSNGFTVGINIPIFYRSKQREGVIEASHDLIGARRNLDDRWATVNYEIKQQYLAAQASQNLMNLYAKAIVPQSSLALESSMSSYEVGKVDFLSMLDNFIYVLDYQVDYYQELSNYESALARLEPLVDRDLTD